jgi:hypothetical protein
MRKTLLIAAAALAAGVISSQAQVYSQNIVGYVNTPVPAGFVNIANPLDASGGNAVTNFINVFSGNYDGDLLYVWGGSSYATYTIDSGQSTGIGNAADSAAVAPPILGPGIAFFFDNTSGSSNTLTFVGTVHSEGIGASTNVVGLTTNVLPINFSYVASKISVGGGISSVLGLPKDGSLDGCLIYVPNVVGGQVHGFTTITIDSGQPTGFGNGSDSAPVAEPVIPVGGGFFLNNTAGAENWVQSL